MSGIYIELSFIDATLNFGQGIIVFAIFGTNTKEVALPILTYWKKLWYGANKLNLPAWHELSSETKHICEQFITHHLQKCKEEIARDRRSWSFTILAFVTKNFLGGGLRCTKTCFRVVVLSTGSSKWDWRGIERKLLTTPAI